MTDVLADRARIEEQVAGRTLIDVLADTVAEHGDRAAYSDKHDVPEGETWRTLTWTEVRETALDAAAGLIALGVQPGDTVAIMATNRIEHFLADIAGVHAAATPMSIYNTLSQEQVAFVADHSQPPRGRPRDRRPPAPLGPGARVRLRRAGRRARPGRPSRRRPVRRRGTTCSRPAGPGAPSSPTSWRQRHAALDPDAPATILYTSGTTGNPKGVVLTHHNVLYEAISTLEAAGLEGVQTQISYLPLAHIAERVLGLYGPQLVASHSHAIGDPAELLGGAGRGAPDGVLRRAARLGEDQDRHLRQARRGPQPRQREDGPGLDGGRAGVGRRPRRSAGR